jgi:uncharacterized protein YdbL (DUF1318 family)
MMNFIPKIVLALATLAMTAGIAFAALTVDATKAQGLVGERQDGMLGIVSSATPDVTSLVDTVNAERLAKYEAIAAKNGTELDQVKSLAGQKLIQGAAAGEYIQNASGGWQKK